MRVYGQLEQAQLENTIPGSISGTQLARLYADITTPSAVIMRFYDGTAWCQVIHQTAGGKTTIPGLFSTAAGVQSNLVIKTSSGSYVCLSTDNIVIINKGTGAATAVTLPSAPETGRRVTIKDGKGDANSNNITVSAASGNIDGSSTSVISTSYGTKSYVYNGTQWNVI